LPDSIALRAGPSNIIGPFHESNRGFKPVSFMPVKVTFAASDYRFRPLSAAIWAVCPMRLKHFAEEP
jgi:hypothetical protein